MGERKGSDDSFHELMGKKRGVNRWQPGRVLSDHQSMEHQANVNRENEEAELVLLPFHPENEISNNNNQRATVPQKRWPQPKKPKDKNRVAKLR